MGLELVLVLFRWGVRLISLEGLANPSAAGRRRLLLSVAFGLTLHTIDGGRPLSFVDGVLNMDVSKSIKERTIAENSLIVLLQGIHGHVTTVELRDESAAKGRIINVDAFMNIRLEEVTYTDRKGRAYQLEDLFVTGRNVRYVHIPDEVDIVETIENQLQAIHRVRNFGGKGRMEFSANKYKK